MPRPRPTLRLKTLPEAHANGDMRVSDAIGAHCEGARAFRPRNGVDASGRVFQALAAVALPYSSLGVSLRGIPAGGVGRSFRIVS